MSVFGLRIEYQTGQYGEGDEGVRKIQVAMERFGENIDNFEDYVFPRVSKLFEKAIEYQFNIQGAGPSAGKWQPLSPAYKKWKDAVAPGKAILELTGKLKAALTQDGPNAFRIVSGKNFGFGTVSLPYASFHQTGGGTLQARPPFDFTAQFETELAREVQTGVSEAARAADLELEK